MQMNHDIDVTAYSIRAYSPNEVRINLPVSDGEFRQQSLQTSFIMARKQLIENWQPEEISQLNETHLLQIGELAPEVVIIGTGDTLNFPSQQLLSTFPSQGIGVEFMDNAAACRTYNILMHEGRAVVLALIQKTGLQ